MRGGDSILLNQSALTPIYYLYSDQSRWDIEQHAYTEGFPHVRCIEFRSAKHGIPFLKVALPKFINMDATELERLTKTVHRPIPFTIKQVGLINTVRGFISQAYKAYKKRH